MHKANKRCLKFLLLAHLRWPWTLSFLSSLACLRLFILTAHRREFAVLLARRECVTCTHAASSSRTHSLAAVYSINSHLARIMSARDTYSPANVRGITSAQRDDALMSAHLRDIFYCTIKRPSNNNNSHVTALAHTHANANAALGRYGNVNGWLSSIWDASRMNRRQGIKSACHF